MAPHGLLTYHSTHHAETITPACDGVRPRDCAPWLCAQSSTVTKETLPGVTNFAKLDTTIACAGATTPAAVAGLKQMGYAAIINLREASEAGADIDAEAAAAKTAGITIIHLPFNTAMPDPPWSIAS
jgi:hypothetical protein